MRYKKGQYLTHCKQGHEINESNVYVHVRKNGDVNRRCLICTKANWAKTAATRKEQRRNNATVHRMTHYEDVTWFGSVDPWW